MSWFHRVASLFTSTLFRPANLVASLGTRRLKFRHVCEPPFTFAFSPLASSSSSCCYSWLLVLHFFHPNLRSPFLCNKQHSFLAYPFDKPNANLEVRLPVCSYIYPPSASALATTVN